MVVTNNVSGKKRICKICYAMKLYKLYLVNILMIKFYVFLKTFHYKVTYDKVVSSGIINGIMTQWGDRVGGS